MPLVYFLWLLCHLLGLVPVESILVCPLHVLECNTYQKNICHNIWLLFHFIQLDPESAGQDSKHILYNLSDPIAFHFSPISELSSAVVFNKP